MRSTMFLAGLSLLMMLSGCASVFSGVDQKMSFKSEPDGAMVYFDGLAKGKTPLELLLRRDEFKEVRFSKPGYQDGIIRLQTKLNKVTLLNFVVISAHTTDAMTGAMFEYYPDAYFMTLQKKSGKKAKVSNLDRHVHDDIRDYVLNYYDVMKQQCLTRCDNEHIDALTTLMSDDDKKDKIAARQRAIKALRISNDAVEYLKQLNIEIQSNS